jgi:hypothetical protein
MKRRLSLTAPSCLSLLRGATQPGAGAGPADDKFLNQHIAAFLKG